MYPAIQPISNKDLRRTASGYGVRIDRFTVHLVFHSGMDFSAKVGTEIYATGNGVVTFAAWKQGYGNCLIIDHGYGYQTLYGHMSKFKKRVGQKVTRWRGDWRGWKYRGNLPALTCIMR